MQGNATYVLLNPTRSKPSPTGGGTTYADKLLFGLSKRPAKDPNNASRYAAILARVGESTYRYMWGRCRHPSGVIQEEKSKDDL